MDTTLYGMKDLIYLLLHLLTTLAKMIKPGGSRAIIAENLLLKQQLIVHSRSRQRAPNLSVRDRVLFGFWTLFMSPGVSLVQPLLSNRRPYCGSMLH